MEPATCPYCAKASTLFRRTDQGLVCCYSRNRRDGGGLPLPLSPPADPSGDISHLANRVGGSRHLVPGPFDGDC